MRYIQSNADVASWGGSGRMPNKHMDGPLTPYRHRLDPTGSYGRQHAIVAQRNLDAATGASTRHTRPMAIASR